MPLFDLDDDQGPVDDDPQAEAHRQTARMVRQHEAERRVAGLVFAARPEGRFIGVGAVVVPLGAAVVAVMRLRDPETALPLLFGATVGGFSLYFIGRKALAAGALAREQRWLRALRFEVKGYFDTLAPEAPRDGKLKIHLVFRDAPPPAEKLDAWLAAIGATRISRTSATFLSPRLSARTGPRGTSVTMHGIYAWQHSLLTRVMVVVDRVYPLRTVRVHFEPS